MHGGKSIQLFKDSMVFSLTDRKFSNSQIPPEILGSLVQEGLVASVYLSFHNTAAEGKIIGIKGLLIKLQIIF